MVKRVISNVWQPAVSCRLIDEHAKDTGNKGASSDLWITSKDIRWPSDSILKSG